jgi:uncharacterized membrane protein YphA (DoxX/SURF4 family)
VGLLLLRAAVGLTAVLQGWAYHSGHGNTPLWNWSVGLPMLLAGTALVVGLRTRIAGGLVALLAVGTAFSWLPAPIPNLFEALLPTARVIVVAIAIALLGPGALSIDARLFGLRKITISRAPRFPNS